jgi:hypothetical protein
MKSLLVIPAINFFLRFSKASHRTNGKFASLEEKEHLAFGWGTEGLLQTGGL